MSRDALSRTRAGQTAKKLREDIIHGRLAPGERLTFEKLAKLYDVGTSPMREALFQVAAEGLVHGEDHKGFIVAPINIGEMLDVSTLRAQLEVFAVTRSIECGGEDWEASLLTVAHRLRTASNVLASAPAQARQQAEDEWERRHRELHRALCSACGSPWLLHFFDALYDQLERYRRYFWKYAERAGKADGEHEQIVAAAMARDVLRATSLLKDHFKRQANLTMAAMGVSDTGTAANDAGPDQAATSHDKSKVSALLRTHQ